MNSIVKEAVLKFMKLINATKTLRLQDTQRFKAIYLVISSCF
jgi:hypothetical protein